MTGHHQEMGLKEKEWGWLKGAEQGKFALYACWWFVGWEELGTFTGRGERGSGFPA